MDGEGIDLAVNNPYRYQGVRLHHSTTSYMKRTDNLPEIRSLLSQRLWETRRDLPQWINWSVADLHQDWTYPTPLSCVSSFPSSDQADPPELSCGTLARDTSTAAEGHRWFYSVQDTLRLPPIPTLLHPPSRKIYFTSPILFVILLTRSSRLIVKENP
ncbi:hypothetical protein RRG08_040661 [Elysia crispata]|uniref:Uncharacterized protein n=1 Tax=Elysia crispata TaxID=231223 RepID=A0AAE1D6H5_9GAST|nr:hypothetical protein RRG08_040661 [Elysia crispata]